MDRELYKKLLRSELHHLRLYINNNLDNGESIFKTIEVLSLLEAVDIIAYYLQSGSTAELHKAKNILSPFLERSNE